MKHSPSYIAILFVILMITFDSDAQRKKRDRDQSDPDLEESLSRDDLMQAEYYFVEGEKFFILEKYDKALEQFNESLKHNRDNAAIHYKIGQVYFALEDHEQALTHLTRAKQIDSDNKYYYVLMADVLTSQSNFGSAAEVYEEMMVKVPGTESYLYELAALYLYGRDLEKALSTYQKAKEHFGITEEIAYQKHQIYLNLGQTENAIKEIQELVDAFPKENIYVVDLARLLINNDLTGEAILQLEKLLEEDPSNAEASVMLSEAYRKSGDRTKAMEALKIAFENPSLNFQAKLQMLAGYMAQLPDKQVENLAIELSGKITDAHPNESRGFAIAGDLHYQLGDKRLAVENYRKAVKLDNSNFSLWQNAIQLEMELQQYDSAIIHSEEALEYFPNQAVLYYFNGTAHLIRKNFQKAVRALEEGKKYTTSNVELRSIFYGQLGDAYNGLEQHDDSDNSYEEALKADPDNDHVLNNYSYFLSLRKKDLEKAVEMSVQLVEKYPDNSTYLDTHAWVLYMLGRYKEAHSFLEKAVGDPNASGTIYEHYGDVLFKLNKIEQALEQWEKAKTLGETSDLIDKKIADKKLYE